MNRHTGYLTMKIKRIKWVMEMTGLPRSTLYHYMKIGVFPKSVKLGERSVGWFEDDIFNWINSRKIS